MWEWGTRKMFNAEQVRINRIRIYKRGNIRTKFIDLERI